MVTAVSQAQHAVPTASGECIGIFNLAWAFRDIAWLDGDVRDIGIPPSRIEKVGPDRRDFVCRHHDGIWFIPTERLQRDR